MTLLIPALLFLLMLIPSLVAASDSASNPSASDTGGEAFAADLYAHLTATAPAARNLFFSPYSIRAALAMTAAGARGETARQMSTVLHLEAAAAADRQFTQPLQPTSDLQLDIANGLWLQAGYQVQPPFLDRLKQDFNAQIQSADFVTAANAARQQVNQWIAQQTQDRIQNLLPADALTPDARLVLANAIYFKAKWQQPFSPDDTRPRPFHLTPDQSASVPFMNREHATLQYLDTGSCQAVELPYRGGDVSMLLLVPKSVDGLPDVEKSLTGPRLRQWLTHLQPRPVQLSIPRFELTSSFQLADTLSSMGMPDAFIPRRADFSGIATPPQAQHEPPLVISQVYHKAYVSVGEQGTEAAAATAVTMRAGAIRRRPENLAIVIADRPFLFLIHQQSTGDLLLFLGRVADPR